MLHISVWKMLSAGIPVEPGWQSLTAKAAADVVQKNDCLAPVSG
jgi:hypothetical protein